MTLHNANALQLNSSDMLTRDKRIAPRAAFHKNSLQTRRA
jgi:hypothetical protein